MLRLRICPNCQEETRSPKAYFCHRCGAELPPPKIDLPSARGGSEADEKSKESDSVERYFFRHTLIVITTIAAITIVAAIGVGVYYFYSQRQPKAPPAGEQISKNEAFVAEVSFEIENHPFSAKGLSEIVPADVDLYLESVDPEILLPSLVSAEDWSKAESFFSEKLGLNASEAASFLEDEFAVVQESTGSAFLARVKDVDFIEQKVEEIGEYDGWGVKMVNGFLVVSNLPDLIHAIEEAQKKLTLNLSLTSGFAEARKGLPKTGQIFVYGKKMLEFIPDSVTGEAFVVSKKDGGILITGL